MKYIFLIVILCSFGSISIAQTPIEKDSNEIKKDSIPAYVTKLPDWATDEEYGVSKALQTSSKDLFDKISQLHPDSVVNKSFKNANNAPSSKSKSSILLGSSSGLFGGENQSQKNEALLAALKQEVVRLFFERGSIAIKPRQERKLKQLASLVNKYPMFLQLHLEGYTDSVGTKKQNLILANQRVRVVRNRLESMGVAPVQIETYAVGEDQNTLGQKNSRRVEIRVKLFSN